MLDGDQGGEIARRQDADPRRQRARQRAEERKEKGRDEQKTDGRSDFDDGRNDVEPCRAALCFAFEQIDAEKKIVSHAEDANGELDGGSHRDQDDGGERKPDGLRRLFGAGVNAGTFQKDQRNGCGQKADACVHEVHNGRCARFFGRLHFYILSFLSVYHTFQTFTRALGRKVPSAFPSLRQASVRKGKNFPNGLYNAARLWYHIAMNFTFISGATGGIGKAFSVLCAKNGDNLYLTGRNNDKLLALKAELSALNPSVTIEVFACDLADPAARDRLAGYAEERGMRFSRILLVAGVDIQKPVLRYTREKLLFQLRVNGEATVDLAFRFLPMRGEECEIVAIGSMSGVTPMPYFALYSATKGMIASFFTALRLELKNEGVRVTTVLPGGVYTRPDIVKEIESQGVWGKLSALSPAYVAEKSLKAVRKNKAVFVPGFFNRLLYRLMKLLPRGITMRFIARRWKKHEKDAF